jgi:hypothetical protein
MTWTFKDPDPHKYKDPPFDDYTGNEPVEETRPMLGLMVWGFIIVVLVLGGMCLLSNLGSLF